jgi:hypothetical protein
MLVSLEIERSHDVLETDNVNFLIKNSLNVLEINFFRDYSINLGLVCLAVQSLRHTLFVCLF